MSKKSPGDKPTWAYVVTTPCTSSGKDSPGVHLELSVIPKLLAAIIHWVFRWAVGTTITSFPINFGNRNLAAVNAKVVFPAPGVATAKKLG